MKNSIKNEGVKAFILAFIVFLIFILFSFKAENRRLTESINTLYDLQGWIQWDMDNEVIPDSVAVTYMENIQHNINLLEKERE
jgi:hypothetical protein